MAGGASYRETVNQQRILQIRQICTELPQLCGDFLRHIALTTGTLTRLAYAIDLRTFFGFLHNERVAFADKKPSLMDQDDLARLTTRDLTAYTEYLTFYIRDLQDDSENPRTATNHELAIKRKLCSVRSFYEYLFQEQLVPSNVTQLLPLPKIHEKPIIRLSRDEVARMLHLAETGDGLTTHQQAYQRLNVKRDMAILLLFLGTGVRVSELVGINISDIDFEQSAFLVTRKGGNQVVLYFPDEVKEALLIYLAEREHIEALPGHEDAFFLSMQKRRITQRAVQNLVKKYAQIAAPLKSKLSPHKLRSTYATNLYEETGDIYLVADQLGHSSVDTTRKHYADMTDARRRMAVRHVHLPPREPAAETEDSEKDRPEA